MIFRFFLFFVILNSMGFQIASAADRSAAMNLFLEGKYLQAAEEFEKIKSDPSSRSETLFYLGVSYARAQNFGPAAEALEQSLKEGVNIESIYYEMGQSYYALQNLDLAEKYFLLSIKKNFKVAVSAYYIGFLRQLRGQYIESKEFYSRIQRLNSDPDQVKQPALFQLAELEYEKVSKIENDEEKTAQIAFQVVPLFERARDYQVTTPTHNQAENRLKSIALEIESLDKRMRNGIPIPLQPYSLKLSNELGYDSNVATEADQALVEVSNKDSYYWKPGVLGKYQMNVDRRYSFTPELNFNSTLYFRRSTPKVYQNDNTVIAPAIRSKWEHMSKGQAATLSFDTEYNYMLRDQFVAHKRSYYSRYWNFILGERVKWFDTGSTTLKLSVKFYENYNPSRNSISPQVSLQQNFKVFDQWDFSNTLSADYLRARDSLNDERNYKMRHSINFTHVIQNVDLTTSLTYYMKDTMNQKADRGNEFNVNPSLNLAHDFTKALSGSLEYDYTHNFSKSVTLYKYSKHEVKWIMETSF